MPDNSYIMKPQVASPKKGSGQFYAIPLICSLNNPSANPKIVAGVVHASSLRMGKYQSAEPKI
jgi:hypothetical protein